MLEEIPTLAHQDRTFKWGRFPVAPKTEEARRSKRPFELAYYILCIYLEKRRASKGDAIEWLCGARQVDICGARQVDIRSDR